MAKEEQQAERSSSNAAEAEPEERTDGWMATYADMVTLLMTFFVLMFAISNVDNAKAEMFFKAISKEGLSAEEFIKIQDKWDDSKEDPDAGRFPTPGASNGDDDNPVGNPDLDRLFNLIDEYISQNGLGDRLSLQFNGEYLMLTLANDILFESGRAQITPELRESVAVVASLLAQTFNDEKPFEIVVAGHTDNRPINTVQYPSNWHLSKDRAVNFLELLIDDSGLDPFYFYARACGEERPIASNDTAEGRQKNRRVEVMISLAKEDPVWWEDFVREHQNGH